MTKEGISTLFTDRLREVQVTRYNHGGARFFIENEDGRHLFADTYNEGATAFLEAALLRATRPELARRVLDG